MLIDLSGSMLSEVLLMVTIVNQVMVSINNNKPNSLTNHHEVICLIILMVGDGCVHYQSLPNTVISW